MNPLTKTMRYILGATLLIPCALLLWIMAVPATMTVSTFAVATAILLSLAAVVITSTRNGSATGSLGQMIYETEISRAPQARESTNRRRQS